MLSKVDDNSFVFKTNHKPKQNQSETEAKPI